MARTSRGWRIGGVSHGLDRRRSPGGAVEPRSVGYSAAVEQRVGRRFRSALSDNRTVAFAILLAVGVRLAFWILTDRVWEDALITVAHARNAVAGIGLTHHPGEPVTYGFTSAISVLVPLAGEIVVRGSGIFVLKAASVIAAALTIVVAARLCGRLGIGRWPTILVLVYLAVDQNQIFYGMAGMETQLAVLILLWSIDCVMAAGPYRMGLSFGLALLVRPDFLLWVASAGLDLLDRFPRRAFVAAGVALLVVAPWLIFTTIYYGSPIPNTILAKSAHFVAAPEGGDAGAMIAWVAQSFSSRVLALIRTFTPFYEDTLVAAAPLPLGAAFLISIVTWALVVVGAVRSRRVPGWRAAVLFAGLFTLYRLVLLPGAYFDWYVPPHTAVLIILAGIGISRLPPIPQLDVRPIVASVLAVAFAVHLPFSIGMERKLQLDVEDAVRRTVGEDLGRMIRPGETLATESAGYYEYYSNATMYDFPGLTSAVARRTLAALPANRRGIEDMIDALQPNWAALRPDEWAGIQALYPATAARYDLVETVTSPEGSILFDSEGRPRIEFWGYVKDASSWKILVLHLVR